MGTYEENLAKSLYYQAPTLYQLEAYQKDGLVVSQTGEIYSEAGIVSSPALNVIARDQATQDLLNYYNQQNNANLRQALADQGINPTQPTSQTGTVATIVPKQVTATKPTVTINPVTGTPVVSIAADEASASPFNSKMLLIGGIAIFVVLLLFKGKG
jgi:hypothetical protein